MQCIADKSCANTIDSRFTIASSIQRSYVYHGQIHVFTYLGVSVYNHFKSSFSNAEKTFYRSFNSVFGKLGRLASEEVKT